MSEKVYVASSWRNLYQPEVVATLRSWDLEVYDFRHPAPGNDGFSWSAVMPGWDRTAPIDPAKYRTGLQHPLAAEGFQLDFDAMQWCDTCLLVLPAGRSASFELGWCMGAGKRGILYMPEPCEPELMYRQAEIVISVPELAAAFDVRKRGICFNCGRSLTRIIRDAFDWCDECFGVRGLAEADGDSFPELEEATR